MCATCLLSCYKPPAHLLAGPVVGRLLTLWIPGAACWEEASWLGPAHTTTAERVQGCCHPGAPLGEHSAGPSRPRLVRASSQGEEAGGPSGTPEQGGRGRAGTGRRGCPWAGTRDWFTHLPRGSASSCQPASVSALAISCSGWLTPGRVWEKSWVGLSVTCTESGQVETQVAGQEETGEAEAGVLCVDRAMMGVQPV